MKINRILAIFAAIYTVINWLFYWHITTMPNATSMIYVFIYPLFWIITVVIVIILAFQNRKTWFNKVYRISTIITLIFCTPLPLGLAFNLLNSDIYEAESGYQTKNGYTFKEEEFIYRNGRQAIFKYYKALGEGIRSDAEFKRDSTWVYFNKNRDTLKTETYKNGILIFTKNYR